MGLFDWIGKSKREEKWMAEDRRLPTGMDKVEPGDDRWIMSHEFASDEHKNLRFYMAAKKINDTTWAIGLYKYDLKHETLSGDLNTWDTDFTKDPLTVVKTLAAFDREYSKDEKYVPINGHRGTYRHFANQYGIHFDLSGNIIQVHQGERLSKGTFMNRESLQALFRKDVGKAPPIDTWEQVYEQLVKKWPAEWTVKEEVEHIPEPASVENIANDNIAKAEKKLEQDLKALGQCDSCGESCPTFHEAKKLKDEFNKAAESALTDAVEEAKIPPKPEKVIVDRPVTLADLSADPAYAQYAAEAKKLVESLKELPAKLADGTLSKRDKLSLVHNLVDQPVDAIENFTGEAQRNLAHRLINATRLVGLLRAGVETYRVEFGKGKLSPDGMALISKLGEAASRTSFLYFGAKDDEAKKVSSIITQGADPNGAELPIERVFAQHPAPEYKPDPAQQKPVQPRKTGQGRHTPFF